MVKNPPANADDERDLALTPGLERSSGEGITNPEFPSILGLEMPWTEEC